MRIFAIIVIFLSSTVSSSEITLKNGQGYIVPDEKVWIIKNAPIAECRVCTADVYIKGEFSNVEIKGVTIHGAFSFSFSEAKNGEIKLYPGTEIWLGDSRRFLVINEQNQ